MMTKLRRPPGAACRQCRDVFRGIVLIGPKGRKARFKSARRLLVYGLPTSAAVA
jgi:hypothetical protein